MRSAALLGLLFLLPAFAQQTEYKRWWQYENRAAKLSPEEFRLQLQSAQEGDPEATMLIAAAYRKGLGVEKNVREGLTWTLRAAERGHPEAQLTIGNAYGRGTELFAADIHKAIMWTRRAAEQGHMIATNNLGSTYIDGIPGVLPRDINLAEYWLTRSAESGFPNAQMILGRMYMEGKERPADLVKAEHWLRKAAERGHVFGMLHLAQLYSTEDGTPRDPDFVERILLRASEMRRPEAQYALAKLYRRGAFGRMDLPNAIEWLTISAAKKYAPSQFMLAEMYEKGEGLATDPATAAQLYLEAAALGYSPAVCKAAQLHYRGYGVPQSNAAAYKWFLIGARLGAPDCATNMHKVERELPEKERLRVTAETEAWITSNRQAMSQPVGKFRWPFGVWVPDDPPPEMPPSDAAGREELVKRVAALELQPTGEEAQKNADWVARWIHDVPDIFFISCHDLMESPKAKSDHPRRAVLEQQMFFSGAAYQVQHLDAKDQLAIYHAGLLGMLRAYEQMIAADPKLRWAVADELLARRADGSLRQYVHQQANKNCR